MTLIEQIRRDREADPGNAMPTSEQIEALSRRWGRVTAMEEALLAGMDAMKLVFKASESLFNGDDTAATVGAQRLLCKAMDIHRKSLEVGQ